MITLKEGLQLDSNISKNFHLAVEKYRHFQDLEKSHFSLGSVRFQPVDFDPEFDNEDGLPWYDIFVKIQQVVNNISDYLEGHDTRRGQIARHIRKNNELLIDNFDTDVFTIHYGGNQSQLSLLPSQNPVEILLVLFQQIKDAENGLDILYLYNQRVFNSVKALLNYFENYFDLIHFQGEKGIREIKMDRQSIENARAKFRYQIHGFEESPLVIRGKLVGLDHSHHILTVQTSADLRNFYVIDPEFKMASFATNQHYRIHSNKIIYRLSNGNEVLKYSVNRLSDIEKI